MKKFLKIFLIIIVVLIAAFYFLVLPTTVSMITDYPRFTFEFVTEDTAMVADYAIGDNRNPADYGYPNYQEVDYKSLQDDIELNGWYVPATKDSINQTLVISHGRTANRLKTMKYLQVIKEFGLDSLYNVFIPDHRNSGKSQEASTAMGYEFAEDITAVLGMLKSRYGQDQFVLWGFSMGAMGSATAMVRPDLQSFMKQENVRVDKLILTSPLSNVYETLATASEDMGIPRFIFDMSYKRFNGAHDDWIDNMKYSYLLGANPLPTLILYGNGDHTTPAPILEREITSLAHVKAHVFEGAEHVQLYTQPQFRARYGQLINDFLRE